MEDGQSSGGSVDLPAGGLPEPDVLGRLLDYLDESIMVVGRDWTVTADLGPPGGLLGHGQITGMHPFSVMHPDDVERVIDDANAAMRSEPGWRGSLEFRAQRADGSYGRFHVEMHNRFDDPILRGMVVVAREVPEPAAGAEGALAADLQIEAIGDHLPIGVLMLDHKGDVVFLNKAACDLLDSDAATLRAGHMPDGLRSSDREEVAGMLERLLVTPGKETFTTTLDEERLLAGTLVSRAGEGSDGAVEYLIITIEDVTHRRAREKHLEHQANHDPLTGLPNRGWLLNRLSTDLDSGREVVVAFVDLDGFKTVNDRLGHAAGDDLLSEIAASLRDALLPGEAVARFGGDEFVVVADRAVDQDDLRERLEAAVAATEGARAHAVGASVGMTASREGDGLWDVLGRADAAMYERKRRAT
jgi:diguanylate cyclase (GGDEF)-like protein/PAS domain S-box-containing protein